MEKLNKGSGYGDGSGSGSGYGDGSGSGSGYGSGYGSGLWGDLNECVTDADRKAGLDIAMLVAPADAGKGEG